MPLPTLLLPLLAVGMPTTQAPPITITGHPWAPFISPMGEPFHAHSATDDTLADWFRQADRNRDGVVTVDELVADADRFFATLDTDHDGEIDPDELIHYEWEVAPDIQVNSRTRRMPGEKPASVRVETDEDVLADKPQRPRRDREDVGGLEGAARYGLLNIPEPVAAADTDFNRSITLAEFRQAAVARFQQLDKARQGRLTLPELEGVRSAMIAAGRAKRGKDDPDDRYGNPLPAKD